MLISSTRFNTKTYAENKSYRLKYNIPVIYATPIKIRDKYPIGIKLFVVEMNNDLNEIEGIGAIYNNRAIDKFYRIHSNTDYNWNIYKGRIWHSREQIKMLDETLVEQLELMLFYGKTHMKRPCGITIITDKLFYQWQYSRLDMVNRIAKIFDLLN